MDVAPESVKSRHDYLAPVIMGAVAILYSLPFLIYWDYLGVGDWELFTTMAAIPVREVLYYHQFPFWNPYIGGGNILFAHPEVAVLSPFFLINMVFGALAGLKVQVFFTFFLGLWGTYLFSRKLGLSEVASYMAAFVYYGSTYFGLHYAIGHMPFTHFCFLPWFLYFLLKSEENWKYVMGAAAAIFLMIAGNGAAVPFVYTAFFSGVLVVLLSIERKSFRLIKRYLFGLLSGVALAAVKFIPMTIYLVENRWPGMPDDRTPLNLALAAFTSLDQYLFRNFGPAQKWGWHEYSAYVSPVVLILALVAILYMFRKVWVWIVIGLFFLVLGLGHFSSFSPWNLLLQIPGFSSLRCPSRNFQFVLLALGILGGVGLDYLKDKISISKRVMTLIMILLTAGVLIGNFIPDLRAFRQIKYKKVEAVEFSKDFRNIIGRKDDIYRQFQANRGSLVTPWLSGYKDSRALVTPTNEVLMEYVSRGQAEVTRDFFSPNRVIYDIEPVGPGSLILSIGYDRGWKAVDGRPIYESNNLVSIDFKTEDSRLELYYRTPYFWTGLVISLLAWAVWLFALFNGKAGERLKAVLD
ncbi:membrane hypothetical protein [Candidatus Zixiibacteriota bacterium]|nr:membrane hypothetical protein [candidate division Zixibacteria bacterium]